MNGTGDTIKLAGSAFHASLWPDQHSQAAVHFEGGMRADCHAQAAAIAQGRIIYKRIFQVSVQHIQVPVNEQM
jgi:hypothetical protein